MNTLLSFIKVPGSAGRGPHGDRRSFVICNVQGFAFRQPGIAYEVCTLSIFLTFLCL